MKNGKHVILYVEDDADFRDSVRTVLESGGYEVVEACSGEEGLRCCQQKHPDLILVDLMMEEVDAGTNLVRDLKAVGCNVPIFVLSTVGDALSASTDYTSLGLAGVLQKPIDFDALLQLIGEKLK
jgi:CheY-like chemotaxis protein